MSRLDYIDSRDSMQMDASSSKVVVYQKRETGFPGTSLLLSVASAGLLYWFGKLGGWGSVLFAAVQFSLMGGFKFYKLFYRTVPRDIRWFMCAAKMKIALRRKTAQKKMVFDFLTETAGRVPDKPAIIAIGLDGKSDRTLTFRELEEYINQIANYFLSCGLKKGDCIAMFLENSPESYALYMGLAKIGAISAMINTNLRSSSLTHCISVSQCVGVVYSSSLGEAMDEALSELDPSLKEMCYCVGGPTAIPEAKHLEDVLRDVSRQPPPPLREKSVNDTVLYVYTSGTTGMPKACKVEDAKLFRSPLFFANAANITESDCVYCILPLYHTHGLVHCGGPMIYSGSTLVIRKKFSAKSFWTDCIKYNCTMVCTIGEMSRYLVAMPPKPTDTQHKVRLTITAGLRKEIWVEYQRRFNIAHIIEFYGSTEGNLGFINIDNKAGSVGALPLYAPSVQNIHFLKLDPDTGAVVQNERGHCVDTGVCEPGEVVCEITKATPFFGYRDQQSSEKKVLRNVFKKGDAFFRTGDIMKIDEEGWVYFCDRAGDTYRWKGENVSTAEVECLIATVLELTDVVVYGVEVPGNEGRAGMAAIVGTEKTIDLPGLPQQLSLSLPPYAVPLFVRLIKAAELTGTFKLQKVKLRKEGFDRKVVDDPLYMLRGGCYVPLTEDLHQQLLAGSIRV